MAKVLDDLVANTRTLLDEAQPVDFTVAEVNYEINYAYAYVISKVVEVYQEFYLTITPYYYSTISGQQQYTIASTLSKIERVEINLQPTVPNNQPQRATAIRMDELPLNLNNNLLNGSTFFNVGYYLIGNQGTQQIGFVPTPQVTATNNIAVWGIDLPSDLVNGTDPVIIPYVDNFAQIIAKIAAANLLKKGQQAIAGANDLLNQANVDILNYQTYISERQSDGVLMIEEAAWDDINTNTSVGY